MSRLIRILQSTRRIRADVRNHNYFIAHPPRLQPKYYFSEGSEDFEKACLQSGIDLLALEVFANRLRDSVTSVEMHIVREKYPSGEAHLVPQVIGYKRHPRWGDRTLDQVTADQLFTSLRLRLPLAGVQQFRPERGYTAEYKAYVALGGAELESLTKDPPSYYRKSSWSQITTRLERISEYFSSRRMRKKVADFETGQCVLPMVVKMYE